VDIVVTNSSDAQLALLLDKQALADNLMAYVRGVDRMDLDLMKSAYWPDARDDHGRFVGNGHQWCEEAMKSRDLSVSVNHHMGNVYSEIADSRAKREAMFLVVTTYRGGTHVLMLGGRYRDLCEKREGEWKILRRTCIWDWNQQFAVDPGWHLTGTPELSNWGRFFPDDPIYQDWFDSPQTHAADANRPEVAQAEARG
jgi:hypothetical protein